MDFSVTIEPAEGPVPVKGPGDWSAAVAEKREAITFEAGKEQIVFGRDRSCDAVFDPTERIVARLHCRLYRQPAGHYAVEALGSYYVELNGHPIERGQSVTNGAQLRLGGPTGPLMRVSVVAATEGDDPLKTIVPVQAKSVRESMGTIRRYQGILAGVLVIAVLIGGWYIWQLLTAVDRMAAFQEDMNAFQTELSNQLAGDAAFDRAVSNIRSKAFAVVFDDGKGAESLYGTAWPIGPGLLATNAHVAREFGKLKGDQKIVVRKPESSISYRVREARLHPGYDEFRDFRRNEAEKSSGFVGAFKGLPEPSAYDVAVLLVDPASDLGEPLKLASYDKLVPGMKVVYAGYPVEGTSAEKTSTISPVPSLKFGYVTSVTDFFLLGADATHSLLVRHSVPATGGASGSAIVDEDGEVVAVLSGGTVFGTDDGKRQPSAVLENYAQRADLLGPLLNPSVAFDPKAERANWNARLGQFDQHQTHIVCEAIDALERAVPGNRVNEVMHLDASLQGGTQVATMLYRDHDVEVEAGRHYGFLVYGMPGRSLSLRLFRGGKPIRSGSDGSFFTKFNMMADNSEKLQLRVIGVKGDPVAYDLYVFDAGPANGKLIEAARPQCAPPPEPAPSVATTNG